MQLKLQLLVFILRGNVQKVLSPVGAAVLRLDPQLFIAGMRHVSNSHGGHRNVLDGSTVSLKER